MITIVNKKTYKPQNVSYEVYIGRPNSLGNPYTHLSLSNTKAKYHVATSKEAVAKYQTWLNKRLIDDNKVIIAFNHLLNIYEEYKKLVLICWCKPNICHGDIVKKFILKITDKTKPIDSFFGYYRFLSNFYPVLVEYNGLTYSAIENAYQAAKFDDIELKKKFGELTSREVYKLTRGKKPREDWDDVKLGVMYDLLKIKFSNNNYLKKRLLATGNRELIEGNTWGDTYWGMYRGVGENHLGKLLMKARKELGYD